eukprot:gene16072-22209_t
MKVAALVSQDRGRSPSELALQVSQDRGRSPSELALQVHGLSELLNNISKILNKPSSHMYNAHAFKLLWHTYPLLLFTQVFQDRGRSPSELVLQVHGLSELLNNMSDLLNKPSSHMYNAHAFKGLWRTYPLLLITQVSQDRGRSPSELALQVHGMSELLNKLRSHIYEVSKDRGRSPSELALQVHDMSELLNKLRSHMYKVEKKAASGDAGMQVLSSRLNQLSYRVEAVESVSVAPTRQPDAGAVPSDISARGMGGSHNTMGNPLFSDNEDADSVTSHAIPKLDPICRVRLDEVQSMQTCHSDAILDLSSKLSILQLQVEAFHSTHGQACKAEAAQSPRGSAPGGGRDAVSRAEVEDMKDHMAVGTMDDQLQQTRTELAESKSFSDSVRRELGATQRQMGDLAEHVEDRISTMQQQMADHVDEELELLRQAAGSSSEKALGQELESVSSRLQGLSADVDSRLSDAVARMAQQEDRMDDLAEHVNDRMSAVQQRMADHVDTELEPLRQAAGASSEKAWGQELKLVSSRLQGLSADADARLSDAVARMAQQEDRVDTALARVNSLAAGVSEEDLFVRASDMAEVRRSLQSLEDRVEAALAHVSSLAARVSEEDPLVHVSDMAEVRSSLQNLEGKVDAAVDRVNSLAAGVSEEDPFVRASDLAEARSSLQSLVVALQERQELVMQRVEVAQRLQSPSRERSKEAALLNLSVQMQSEVDSIKEQVVLMSSDTTSQLSDFRDLISNMKQVQTESLSSHQASFAPALKKLSDRLDSDLKSLDEQVNGKISNMKQVQTESMKLPQASLPCLRS